MKTFLLAVALLSSAVFAQVPNTLSHQGRVLKADGSPEVGTVSMTFKILNSGTGGTELWSETQSVALSNGLYSATLGLTTALPANVFDSPDRWVEVQVNGVALAPRQKMAAVPYARTATNVNGGTVQATAVTSSGAVNGVNVSASALLAGFDLESEGQYWKRAAARQWHAYVDPGNSLVIHAQGKGGYALALQGDHSVRIDRVITRAIADEPNVAGPGLFESDWTFLNNVQINGTLGVSGQFNAAGIARMFDPEVTGGLYWHQPFSTLGRKWGASLDGNGYLRFSNGATSVMRLTTNKDVIFDRDIYVQGYIYANVQNGTITLANNTQVFGNLSVSGVKNFVAPHPKDASKEIAYVSLEAGEAGTYWRGKAKLKAGEGSVKLPEHFALLTNASTLTVQVTPSRGCKGWVAADVSDTFEVKLSERGAADDCEVSYFVQGVRKGYENLEVIRPRSMAAVAK